MTSIKGKGKSGSFQKHRQSFGDFVANEKNQKGEGKEGTSNPLAKGGRGREGDEKGVTTVKPHIARVESVKKESQARKGGGEGADTDLVTKFDEQSQTKL